MLKAMRYPDLFHGHQKRRNFFEGWYFKLVNADRSRVFVVIAGLNLGSRQEAHSFIQVFDGVTGAFEYIQYPVKAFTAKKDTFSFRVDKSVFTLEGIHLDIAGDTMVMKGALSFADQTPWPDSPLSPGSMGPYNYIPRMQCYSQVCVMDMALEGSLLVNGENIPFTGGRGYIEKNWGKAFPYGWVWVQCNHFSSNSVSLSASIGHISFLMGSFRGFLIGLLVYKDFYIFTTMNKSRLEITNGKRGCSLWLRTEPTN